LISAARPGRRLDDRRDRRVVDVADLREQAVLDRVAFPDSAPSCFHGPAERQTLFGWIVCGALDD
jgi:hypothetical protein